MKKVGLILAALLTIPFFAQANTKCVNLYFDRTEDPKYWMGKTYANFIQNLLGHFPEFQQIISPIELYRSGDIERCDATIYISSYFNNKIPDSFKQEVKTTKKNIAWLGYNIWTIDDYMQNQLGYKYKALSTLNRQNTDAKGRPSFYKNVHYKGEVFYKYGEWSKIVKDFFNAPFEQALFTKVADKNTEILAYSENPITKETAPYAFHKDNFFYIADVPLSFMHEADRFLIFSDLLFDILKTKPRHNGKYAFLRIEDVHPLVKIEWLYKTNEILVNEQVPINISIIPIFFDPFNAYNRKDDQEFVTALDNPAFMTWLNDTKKEGANFIWHGITHQHGRNKNPHTGISGEDFEFFDANNNKPIPQDSATYVLNKLNDGLYELNKIGIQPKMWLTPHYQASPLDYVIFGNSFPWNVGRVIYYNFSYSGLNENLLTINPSSGDDERLWFDTNSNERVKLRADYFKNLTVNYESPIWSGQMFPYEIYGDVHGQRIIPENLGNSQPFVNAHVVSPRTKEDIIRDAKRNLVLRDAWASFFYHPFLFTSYENGGRGSYPGDGSELTYIIQNLKKLGYKFIDINEFMKKNTRHKRPNPIYRELEK